MLILVDSMKIINTENYVTFEVSKLGDFWAVEAVDNCSNHTQIKITSDRNKAKTILRGIYKFMTQYSEAIEIIEIDGNISIKEFESEDLETETESLEEKLFEEWKSFLCDNKNVTFLDKLKKVKRFFNLKDNDNSEFSSVVNSAIRRKIIGKNEQNDIIRKILVNIIDFDNDNFFDDDLDDEEYFNNLDDEEYLDDLDEFYEEDDDFSFKMPFDLNLKGLLDDYLSNSENGKDDSKQGKEDNKKTEDKPVNEQSLEELFSSFKDSRKQSEGISKNVEKTLGTIGGILENLNNFNNLKDFEDKNKGKDSNNDNKDK